MYLRSVVLQVLVLFCPLMLLEARAQDYGIIQRNFMPKTDRWQLGGSFSLIPNDVFYRTLGATAFASYHLNETYGAELSYSQFFSIKSDELAQIESVHSITAQQTTVKSVLGISAYLNWVYGKFSFLNRRIIPFEFFQTVGPIIVQDSAGGNNLGLQISIGELFSLGRSDALRGQISLLLYNSKDFAGAASSSQMIVINFGYSKFYPEPSYR